MDHRFAYAILTRDPPAGLDGGIHSDAGPRAYLLPRIIDSYPCFDKRYIDLLFVDTLIFYSFAFLKNPGTQVMHDNTYYPMPTSAFVIESRVEAKFCQLAGNLNTHGDYRRGNGDVLKYNAINYG